jgi:hypothetical protein
MDLIYTDAAAVDQGVLKAYDFDLSYGDAENDFKLVLDVNDTALEFGSSIYMEGTEYGGIVDGIKVSTNGETVTYTGRTWHGVLNSKVIEPDAGTDYLTVSGDANTVLAFLISRMGLASLFKVVSTTSGIVISGYKMHRYVMGYDGICAMLADSSAKLRIEWKDKAVHLSAVPVVDYTAEPIDGDIAALTVEQQAHKVNHLICLGKGTLAEREVIHLYADADGNISDTPYYTGADEVAATYENTNSEDLRSDSVKKFKELRNTDKFKIFIPESDTHIYDIGDIVGAEEHRTGIHAFAAVTQKIVKINNGAVAVEYQADNSVQRKDS